MWWSWAPGWQGRAPVRSLRSAGVTGQIVLVGGESEPPYDRPPLTKDPDAEVDLRPAMGVDVWAHADEVRLGVTAQHLDLTPGAGGRLVVTCSDGTRGRCRRSRGRHWRQPHPAAGLGSGRCARAAHASRGGALLGRRAPGGAVGGRRGWLGRLRGGRDGGRPRCAGRPGRGLRDACWPVEFLARCADRVGRLAGGELGVTVHVGRPVRAIEDAGGLGGRLGNRGADLVLVALGVRPATELAGGLGSGAGPWRSGPRRPVGAFERPGGVRRRRRRRRVGRPGYAMTPARWALDRGAQRPGVGGARGRAVGGPWRRRTRRVGVARRPACRPAIRSRTCFSDVAGRRLLVLGAPGQGRVVWREATHVAAPGSEAWSAFTLDTSDRLLGMCTSGRPRDLAAARRAMLAHPTGTPRTDPAALADPDADPAAMFPGRAERWGSGPTWR